ncbi:MAG: hypothetical protein CL776_00960 [Chloroflexi bacterium]|nr:hypothetical protein [Chloroflexota bacterium]
MNYIGQNLSTGTLCVRIGIFAFVMALFSIMLPIASADSHEESPVSSSGSITQGINADTSVPGGKKGRMNPDQIRERIAAAVESGDLTQAEADEKLAKLEERVANGPGGKKGRMNPDQIRERIAVLQERIASYLAMLAQEESSNTSPA